MRRPARDLVSVRAPAAGLAAVTGAVVLVALGTIVADGWDPVVAVVAYLGPVALATVIGVRFVADRVQSLARQFVVAGAVTVAGLAAGIALFVNAMYVSQHDALFTVLLAGYGILIGSWSAWLLGRRALRRLAAAEAARRDLITGASHELRTPVTALRLLAEAVADEIVDADMQRSYLRQMAAHAAALGRLIDDLFELSRLEAGDIQWALQRVRAEPLVYEAVDAMRPSAEAGRVTVRAELDPALPPVQADPERLQRVLFSLIQSAIRHTPPDGSVVVRAQAGHGELRIEVADTGSAIPADERERFFEPLFRAGTGTARGGAPAGVGLAISRAIVEAHGGRICLTGSGPGTCVRFSLPAATPQSRSRGGGQRPQRRRSRR
jgi:signal transduction histidine kinase